MNNYDNEYFMLIKSRQKRWRDWETQQNQKSKTSDREIMEERRADRQLADSEEQPRRNFSECFYYYRFQSQGQVHKDL